MEFALNLAWVLLAASMFCVWLQDGPRIGPEKRTPDRRMQFVALAVLILILFPVISVTDDLLAAQNPAEVDCCLRKDHVASNAYSSFSAVAVLTPLAFSEPSSGLMRFTAPRNLPAPIVDHPALAGVQNRPPPAA